jgi:hypothetical protein
LRLAAKVAPQRRIFMKTTMKLFGIIALVAVIIFTLGSCIINVPDDTPNYSLDGSWKRDINTVTIRISGSSAYITQINYSNLDTVWKSAYNQGMYKVGNDFYRNISKTGERTWRAQYHMVEYYTATNVATRVYFPGDYGTITMSVDGKTIEGTTAGATWTRQ